MEPLPEPDSKRNRAELPNEPLRGFTELTPNAFPDSIDPTVAVTKVPQSAAIPWFGVVTPGGQLWVRRSYLALWDVVRAVCSEPGHYGLIVSGNPGIGKSVGALNTIAALSIKANPTRLVAVIMFDVGYVFVDGAWYQTPDKMGENSLTSLKFALIAIAHRIRSAPGGSTPELLLLHDVKSAEGSPRAFPYQAALVFSLMHVYVVHCVLFASPQVGNTSIFVKEFPSRRFYLPTWSLEELQKVKDELRCPSELEQRFPIVGGVVRWLNADVSELSDLAQNRDTALADLMGKGFIYVRDASVASTSTLFQVLPSEDYSKRTVTFLCEEARQLWLRARREKFGGDARRLLKWAMEAACSPDVLGRLFEEVIRYCLRDDEQRLQTVKYLGEGTTPTTKPRALADLFPSTAPETPATGVLRSAGPFATGKKIAVLALPVVTSTTEFTGEDPNPIKADPGLYVPKNSNFPFVDFVLVTAAREAWIFQVTVSKRQKNSLLHDEKIVKHFQSFTPPLQPFLVWVGLDADGVSTLQRCSDAAKTPISMPQFSWHLGINSTEVWLQEKVAEDTPPATPFSLLLEEDSKKFVEGGLKALDPTLTLDSQKDETSDSTPGRPWRFKYKAAQ